jgi:tungstate transport system substrate-binding protein
VRVTRVAGFLLAVLAAAVAGACSPEPSAQETSKTSAREQSLPKAPASAQRRIRLATTTSTRDSGLLDTVLPVFEKESGNKVDVLAVGTGAAFRLAKDGNADLLLVHDRKGEEDFIRAGDGRARREICWNTFEVLGPADDPAGVKTCGSAGEALQKIARSGARFVSRGDDSGTHRRELSLWKSSGGLTKWPGYRDAGQGMGPTLLVADETMSYVLADRGTALSFRTKLHVVPLLADTPELRNVYSVVRLDTKAHPEIAATDADALADWLEGAEAEKLIADFKVDGEPLFHAPTPER